MHKYGKLTSCNADNPTICDKMFMQDLMEILKK